LARPRLGLRRGVELVRDRVGPLLEHHAALIGQALDELLRVGAGAQGRGVLRPLRRGEPGRHHHRVGRGALLGQQIGVDDRAHLRGLAPAEQTGGSAGAVGREMSRRRRGSRHGDIVPDRGLRRAGRSGPDGARCGPRRAPRHTGTMTAASDPARTVAVVGAGPRGTAIIERLVAASTTPQWHGSLTVHLIDPLVGHGGAVWRDDQSEVLLMNTTTCQTTMYPDESCHALLPVPRSETLAEHLAGEGLRPTDFAPRAAHGRYLAHVLETAKAAAAPERLRIVEHAAEAVDVTGPADGTQRVRLSDGRVLRA